MRRLNALFIFRVAFCMINKLNFSVSARLGSIIGKPCESWNKTQCLMKGLRKKTKLTLN